ncbi:MAG TPA: DUF11 domain-containing protein, partial [Pirellulaceae bacterium]|nr:DUF11 domain-containing protein [Pirellulaceae bacterium]
TLTPNVVDLAVTKTVNDSTPDRNQEVTYTITVTNTTSITATGVQLTDPTPSGITNVRLVNASQGTFDANTGVWTVGTINGSGSATLQIAGTVSTTGTGGSVVNTASITAVNQFETNTTNNQASATLVPNQVDLSVTKTVDDSTPDRNQEVVYTITVSNATGPAATNVQLTDVLPAGITAARVDSASQGSYSTSNGVWTIGTINGGGSATLRLAGTVSSIPSGTTLTNTATISALDQFESRTDNNSASAIVTPNQVDLRVTKTVDDSTLDRNQNGTFTVTVTNLSNITATNVVVTDQFPSALTLTGTPTASQGTYVSGTGVWTVGTLNGGASATLTMAGRTDTVATGSITNTASLTSVSQFESPTTNNSGSASVTLNQVDIAVTKTVNSTNSVSVNRNEEVLFVITATNNGPSAASNVQINDVLPTGLTLVGTPTASAGTFDSNTGVWTIPSLSATAGQNSATLQVRARLTATGNNITLTNQASLSSVDQFDQVPTNNTASATVRNSVLSKRNYLADAF